MKAYHFKEAFLYFFFFCFSPIFLFGQDGSWSGTMQVIDISPYVGKKFKLEATVKMESASEDAKAQLWVRIDKADRTMGFFDNMDDRPIKSKEWAVYKIEGIVDEDAKIMNFGSLVISEGKFYFDDFKLSVWQDNAWVSLPIENPGFEITGPNFTIFPGWGKIANNFDTYYAFSAYQEDVKEGKNVLLIKGKAFFPARELLSKFVGEWSYDFEKSCSTASPRNFVKSKWTFKKVLGNYGIEGTLSDLDTINPAKENLPELQFLLSYHPELESLYLIYHLADHSPIIFQGTMDREGNITTKQITPGDQNVFYTMNWSFNWVNENELTVTNKVEVNDEKGNVVIYCYRLLRMESLE